MDKFQMHLILQASICWILFSVAASSCPSWSRALGMKQMGHFCYYLMDEHKVWQDAEDWCHDQDQGHLMAITSQSTMETAVSLLTEHSITAVWAGARKSVIEWTWLTGTPLGSYKPWTTLPVPGTNGCAVIDIFQGLKWVPKACSQRAAFLCQLPLSSLWCGPQTPIVSNKCVYIDYGSHNWFIARELCHRMGGNLVTIVDEHTGNTIQRGVNSSLGVTKFWIGLRRENWSWSTGSDVLASFWKYGEPSQRGQCLALMDINQAEPTGRILWSAHNCTDSLPYLCQLDFTPGAPEPLPALVPLYVRSTPTPSVPTPEESQTSVIPSSTGHSEISDGDKKGKGGLTGGLVFLFLLMLVVLGGIVVLFFLYVRRGKILRERARAQAALGKTQTDNQPPHQSCPSDFVNKTFTVNDGTVAIDFEDVDIPKTTETSKSGQQTAISSMFNIIKEQRSTRQTSSGDGKGRKEICGAHGEDMVGKTSNSKEKNTEINQEKQSQDRAKPEKPSRPKPPDWEAYNTKRQQHEMENSSLPIERKESLLPKKKKVPTATLR